MNTNDIIKGLKNLENLFDFSNLNENHDRFSDKNEKPTWNFKIKTPKCIYIDELVCLRSKMHPFKCGDECKNKLKDFSKIRSKNIKLEEYEKYLDGKKYPKM